MYCFQTEHSLSLVLPLLWDFVKYCSNIFSLIIPFQGKNTFLYGVFVLLIACVRGSYWLTGHEPAGAEPPEQVVIELLHHSGLWLCEWVQGLSVRACRVLLLTLWHTVLGTPYTWGCRGREGHMLGDFLLPLRASNWKIWVALFVCFSGMQWAVFFRRFLNTAPP